MPSSNILSIQKSQRKLAELQKTGIITRATQSSYNALSRQDKRIAEHYHDTVTREGSFQKDLRRAETMAHRIAQVIHQLFKDVTKIKQFMGNYGFSNTVGKDSDATGSLETDLSTAVDTRSAWKDELKNMITMLYHYVDAQHLGNYRILSDSPTTSDVSCGTRIYRSVFFYTTPVGDCLSIPSTMGGHSGDSVAVQPDGDTNESTAAASTDTKDTTNSYNQIGVSNPDLGLRALWEKYVINSIDAWKVVVAAHYAEGLLTTEYTDAATTDGGVTNVAQVAAQKVYLANMGYSEALIAAIFVAADADPSVDVTLIDVTSIDEAYTHTNSIDNIEDESDLPWVMRPFAQLLETIRTTQQLNDGEQQRICYARDTSECNQAYYQSMYDELTVVDMVKVSVQLQKGNQLCQNLNLLYADEMMNQPLFGDGGIDGNYW